MIHLVKAKGGFMVVTLADNGEPLATSEILTTKESAINNLLSQNRQHGGFKVLFQDDTARKSIIYKWTLGQKAIVKTKKKPGKKYKVKTK